MKPIASSLLVLAGSTLLAAVLYALAAVPGLLSDRASTVPVAPMHEVTR